MALSPASGLANYSSGISSSVLTVDSNSDRVGIGTTNPQDTLQVGTAITMGSGTVTATQGNFQNVSIAGTLTYEDTTSVDSVGIITARSGISITGGGLSVVGDTDLVGNLTGVNATGISTIVNLTSTNVSVTGVTTLGNTVVGGGTTQLVVNGNARITGILTIGTSSITLDGTQNKITTNSYDFLGISTSHDDTAVDVFLYDTSRDSDGGEWTKKTRNTSWYNETLNTATRGSRREFPSVVAIVMESQKITIYDADDPDLPMWMVFNSVSGQYGAIYDGRTLKAVSAANGMLYGVDSVDSVLTVDFIRDNTGSIADSGSWTSNRDIADRNPSDSTNLYVRKDGAGVAADLNGYPIFDVDTAILPNAVDIDNRGLPYPTIAVATNQGVTIVSPSLRSLDLTGFAPVQRVKLGSDGYVAGTAISGNNDYTYLSRIPGEGQNEVYNWSTLGSKEAGGGLYWNAIQGSSIPTDSFDSDNTYALEYMEDEKTVVLGGNLGLQLWGDKNTHAVSVTQMEVPVCSITTSYISGWRYGDAQFSGLGSLESGTLSVASSYDGTTELITNGTFASDISGWTAYNATLTHQTDSIRVGDNGTFSKAYQSFGTVVGKVYLITIGVKTISGTGARVHIGAQNSAQLADNDNILLNVVSDTGTFNFTYTATATTTYIELHSLGSNYVEYNFVGVTPVFDKDFTRLYNAHNSGTSPSERPAKIMGSITKSAVAPGASLQGYSGFSASNLMVVNRGNTGFNFGGQNSTVYISGWFKTTSTTGYQYIAAIDELGNAAGSLGVALENNTGKAYLYDGTNDIRLVGDGVNYADGVWHKIDGIFSGNVRRCYVDGKRVLDIQESQSDNAWGTPTDYPTINNIDSIHIGHFRHAAGGNDHYFDGSLSLVRVSKSSPEPETILKSYREERELFRPNAQCGLTTGGTSRVTAVGYDSITQILHVGGPSGRSDLQGLVRINNTTTGITTAISAYDGFILEQ